MNAHKRLNRMVFLIGIVSAISALFFSGLNFGLERDSIFFPIGSNPYREMAIRYFVISIFFILSTVFFQVRNKLFPQIAGLILLIFVMLQCRILIASKPDEVPDWIADYLSWLRLVWQTDFFLFVAAIVLVVLQVYLIKLNHSLSDEHGT